MENEMRTFGYLCPACGKPVMAARSLFALEASGVEVECECGGSALRTEFDGQKCRIFVPCGLCGETHTAQCSPEQLARREGVAFGCAKTQEFCCYVGDEGTVEKHLRELCALTELPVPPEAVSGADCPGDWLVLALMNTYQAADFHRFTGVRPPELREAPAGLTVRLHRIDGEEEEQQEVTAADSAAVETPDVLPDEAALAFAYGHGAATVTPTKVTATQLKGRAIDEEIAEGALPRRWESVPEKPRFLQEKHGLTGAERGTAMHLVMQFLPLDTPPEPEAVRALAETLTARRLLTPEQAAALDVPALARFLSSPLAARIRAAKQVWREYRFSLLTDAGLYDPAAAGEEMLLQGVADCVFETADGLTVVDFKTDRVTAEEAPRRAEVYRAQLDAYAGALAKILQKPVTERVLYFFACDREISL